MSPFSVGGSHLHRRDDLAPTFDFGARQDPRPATVGAMCMAGMAAPTEQTIQRSPADAVERAGGEQELLTIRVFGRQGGQTPTEHHQRLNGDAGARRHQPAT